MWFLEASVLERLNAALQLGLEKEFSAHPALAPSSPSGQFGQAENQAVIKIEGILTKKPSGLIRLFYGANTTYDDIIAQVAAAESDPRVTSVRFDVDSPGGEADGLFAAMDAVRSLTKPKSVYATKALSAAYGLAAVGGKITAGGTGAQFGSVGAAADIRIDERTVSITSSNAPDKRPDPTTEEGRKTIVAFLDKIEGLYVDAIAGGRGVAASEVRSGYGRGGIVLAADAEQRGMIDGIAGAGLRVVPEPQATAQGGSEDKMDLEKLRADHPAVFKEAVNIGMQQERDRVMAHLKLGKAGDMDAALTAIEEGSEVTQLTYADHMAAALSRRDTKAREDDNKAVEDATNGAKPKAADEMDQLHGQTLKLLQGMVGEGSI